MDPRQQEIAHYMQQKFRHGINDIGGHVSFPLSWSFDVLYECDHAVRILVSAFRNQSKVTTVPPDWINRADVSQSGQTGILIGIAIF